MIIVNTEKANNREHHVITLVKGFSYSYGGLTLYNSPDTGARALNNATEMAINKMIQDANRFDADAIVNVKIDVSCSDNKLMVIAVGTAVKLT